MASTPNTLSKSNTVNKERNKIRKAAGSVNKKDNNKKLQKPSHNQVIQVEFLLQMVII